MLRIALARLRLGRGSYAPQDSAELSVRSLRSLTSLGKGYALPRLSYAQLLKERVATLLAKELRSFAGLRPEAPARPLGATPLEPQVPLFATTGLKPGAGILPESPSGQKGPPSGALPLLAHFVGEVVVRQGYALHVGLKPYVRSGTTLHSLVASLLTHGE